MSDGHGTDNARDDYADIIGLPRPVSKRHKPMAIADRAAQFAPFSALTGYEAVLSETVRRVSAEAEKNG